jgi:RNA-directed DNA polymerase
MEDIFFQITSLKNLYRAWQEFRCGKRKKRDVQEFEQHLEDNIFSLHRDLLSNRYRHDQYNRFHIFDPKHRIIHKATVRDRLVHHAIHRVTYPIFNRSFIFDSYSCRVGKGTHAAVDRLARFSRKVSRNYTAPCSALKFDIKKFFDSVDHDILMNILSDKIVSDRALGLLSSIVGSFSVQIPLGGGTTI